MEKEIRKKTIRTRELKEIISFLERMGWIENIITYDNETVVQIETTKEETILYEIIDAGKENEFIVNTDYIPKESIYDKDTINNKEHHLFIVESTIDEMKEVIALAKNDYQEEEATAIRDELIELLDNDSLLDGVDISLITRIDTMVCRGWLFNYKGRGFVLIDMGNCHWSYLCTVEEMLVGMHYNQFAKEY